MDRMRVVLAGRGAMASALMDALFESAHHLVGLISQQPRWLGIGDPVQRRARQAGVPVLGLDDLGALVALSPDLLVCGDFGVILPATWLDVPQIGGINAHWSLLPRHRGPAPGAACILAGDTETGLTFHVLTSRIDAGLILDQQAFPLEDRENSLRIYHRAASLARTRLPHVLARIQANGLSGTAPDLSRGSYMRRLTREQARIDWTSSAEDIDRLVRACTSPMAHFAVRGRTVFLSVCEPVDGEGLPGEILSARPTVIATGDGAIRIDRAITLTPPFTWPGWPTPRVGTRLSAR